MTKPHSLISPPPRDLQRSEWHNGAFESARRGYTEAVEGSLCPPQPIVFATLRGGAKRHIMATGDGCRYEGPDRAGMISFLPGGCERRLRLEGVAWEWASLTLRSDLIEDRARPLQGKHAEPLSFVQSDDLFVLGLLSEMDRLQTNDGQLDPLYCDAMSAALTFYMDRRFWRRSEPGDKRPFKLPPWRVRRVTAYIDANLSAEIRIGMLAEIAGCSEGHFHRAFRSTLGETPLHFIHGRRIERAKHILSTEDVSVAEVGFQVGFSSPSHFARTFRAFVGMAPSVFRAHAAS